MKRARSEGVVYLVWAVHRHRTPLFWVTVGLVACFAIYITSLTITRQPLGFDEGWNLQAPLNVAKHGVYASFGAVYDGRDKIFDPYLSTGSAVSLPIALIFKIFGVGVLQARIVMLGFYVAALGLLSYYVYDRSRSYFAILAPLSLLLLNSSGIPYRTDVLGEIPASAYVLASLILWRKKSFLLAGLLAGLAVQSKFLLMLAPAAGCLVLAVKLLESWRRGWPARRAVAIDGLRYGIGVAIPLIAWEILRFIEVGSPYRYYRSIREFAKFFRENGSGISANGTVLTAAQKFNMILDNVSYSRTALMATLVIALVLLAVKGRKLLGVVRSSAYGLTFLALYLVWWLGMSNGAYTRYTVPFVVVSIGVGYGIILERSLARLEFRPVAFIAKFILLIMVLAAVKHAYFPIQKQEFKPTLTQQQQLAARLTAAHPGALTHIGWWQNPEMLFLSDLRSKEIGYYKDGEPYNLLISPAMRDIAPRDYANGLVRCQHVDIQEEGYVLCAGVKSMALEESFKQQQLQSKH